MNNVSHAAVTLREKCFRVFSATTTTLTTVSDRVQQNILISWSGIPINKKSENTPLCDALPDSDRQYWVQLLP